ncbi:MAG: type II toxin-antitoxin system VapC family toxin [Rectinema subterraneum]|uniref:type II toxin-antitoxin system VapC family toxin n=1 Tax=Rectinema subterraneum TaxID=2653714 RepID=UPI003C7A9FA7
MIKILLDTNAYTAFMAGDQHVFSYMVDSEVVYISTIVIGELFAGFYGGDKVLQNKEELKLFLSKDSIKIIDVAMETAEIFGELKSALARKGRMIPLNDIWIAAHAIEYGSKLITYDEHFKNIDGVRIWEYLN